MRFNNSSIDLLRAITGTSNSERRDDCATETEAATTDAVADDGNSGNVAGADANTVLGKEMHGALADDVGTGFTRKVV